MTPKIKNKKAMKLFMWPIRVSLVTSSAECVCVWIWFGHACYMQVCTSNVKLQVPAQGVVCMYMCVYMQGCLGLFVYFTCMCVHVCVCLLHSCCSGARQSWSGTPSNGQCSVALLCPILLSSVVCSCFLIWSSRVSYRKVSDKKSIFVLYIQHQTNGSEKY